MLNSATRTVRTGASTNFNHAMHADEGMATNRKTPLYSTTTDRTGAHSVAALDRFICDSKNGATYSNNIKASIGEPPEPSMLVKAGMPHESFRNKPSIVQGKLATRKCDCGRLKPIKPSREGFCGCGRVFVDNASNILTCGPIVLVILVLIAAFLFCRIIITRKNCMLLKAANASLTGGEAPDKQPEIEEVVDIDSVDIV